MKIDYQRDKYLADFGIITLQDRYMVEGETSPQDVFARAAKAFADDDAHAQRMYDYVSNLWCMFSTPISSNGGTERGLPISCFLNYVGDSRDAITAHYTENAYLSSMGGGIGGVWSDVRSVGSKTSKGSESTGVIPFIKVVDSEMLAFSQGVTRRGSYAAWLHMSHPEIEEFLDVRKPTGGDIHRKSLNLHQGVVIPNDFMELVKKASENPGYDDSWPLIDPHSGEVKKTVPAKVLWIKILENRFETGEPFIMFEDHVNDALPQFQKDLGLYVHHSNLCVAPETQILTDRGYFPISDLEGEAVNVWNGVEFSPTVVRKTGEDQELLEVAFSNGGSIKCTPYHKFYILEEDVEKEVRAGQLKVGDSIYKFKLPDSEGIEEGIRVESIRPAGRDDTYCFNEPKRNRGVFNGILTGQCSEITLATSMERTAVCCLSSVNLEEYDQWKDDPQFIPDLVRFLDNVIEYFVQNAPPELARAVYSASRERSLGIGGMGFHAYLQRKNIPWESAIARSINMNMWKHISTQAKEASRALALERGPCPDAAEMGIMDVRNAHLLAIAPNATSSIICGNTSPSIEPYASNAFNQKTLSGTKLFVNEYLSHALDEAGINTPEVIKSIFSNGGSVQHLDELDDYTKDVFKTADEIPMEWVIQFASDRQTYICQSQSLNLHLPPKVSKEELHRLHLAAWEKKVKTLYYLRTKAGRRADNLSKVAERQVIKLDDCLGCE